MNKRLPRATHQGEIVLSTPDGNEIKIPCAVLDDGTRVLRERSVAKAIGRKGGGAHWQRKRIQNGALLPEYVSVKNLEPFIDKEMRTSLLKPITYITISGTRAHGMPAELLPKICDIWLKARENGALSEIQLETAKRAEILVRGFAHVGIIALIDEATGYQEVRDRLALRKILDKYLLKDYAKWAKRFPDEFYEQMFRLKGWQWKGMKVNRPSIVGKYTNDLVYERLAPNLLSELRRINPPDESGRRKAKHQQWLTEDIGHPALQRHLAMLIGFERASANWGMFYRMVQRALPKCGETIPLALEE